MSVFLLVGRQDYIKKLLREFPQSRISLGIIMWLARVFPNPDSRYAADTAENAGIGIGEYVNPCTEPIPPDLETGPCYFPVLLALLNAALRKSII